VRTVVVCVGNALRGDDAVGPLVAERLRERVGDVDVVVCEQEPSRLLDAWAGAEAALVVDAVSAGAAPGTIHRFDASDHALPATVFRGSTHALGVGEVIELGRALGRLPRRLLVYGVEGRRFAAGEAPSRDVSAALDVLVAELVEEARCTTAR
jgi:hydrogenase maturation protease